MLLFLLAVARGVLSIAIVFLFRVVLLCFVAVSSMHLAASTLLFALIVVSVFFSGQFLPGDRRHHACVQSTNRPVALAAVANMLLSTPLTATGSHSGAWDVSDRGFMSGVVLYVGFRINKSVNQG